MMPLLSRILLIVSIVCLGVSAQECEEVKPLLSKCYGKEDYQWVVAVPRTRSSCDGRRVPQPKAVQCNFACPEGQTFDQDSLNCKECPEGTFSLGGGLEYTFNSQDGITSLPKEISLKTESLINSYDAQCKTKKLWQVKGTTLQGDVQPNCVINFILRFKLIRRGSIKIAYSLPTSVVLGIISSRCDFDTHDDDDDPESEGDSMRSKDFSLSATGYGVWEEKKIEIDSEGDYKLQLFTMGLNAFHFPFLIRSIVVQGSSSLQECIPCPAGTSSSQSGTKICEPCTANTYARREGSTECKQCDSTTEYSDEGATKCLPRPTCAPEHYRKVFTGCDVSDTAKITYEPIQPKICIGDDPHMETESIPCGTCNPGMYKDKTKCEFCPAKTYSNGTLSQCLPCASELSLLPGLYYHNWNELPMYLNRSYMSFATSEISNTRTHSQSWIPSIKYITAQALPDTLSVLSLTIEKGFRQTEIAKTTKEYGTLSFKFSTQCQSSCSLFLVSQNMFDDDGDWDVLSRWTINEQTTHAKITEYSYSVQHPNEVVFSWLFTSDDTKSNTDDIRIYEIRVTNTVTGGSDRCVSCLTKNNEKMECQACLPGQILSNNSCISCPPSSLAGRIRPHDPVPTICLPCPNNTISDDGISCYVPCRQQFNGSVEYDLTAMSTIEFHGSKLFTQKGSGYFHVFNASICGKTSVTCTKSSTSDSKRSASQTKIESKLCRMGSVPDKNENITAVAYIDDFGEKLSDASLLTLTKYFPPLRSDYNLSDITLIYRANVSNSQSACSEHMTYLSLRCDHVLEEEKINSTLKYELQTPTNCATGTCDGCTFYFLLRTPLACPVCDDGDKGYRTFVGPCKFGRQEVRKIPHPYCTEHFSEKVETRRCSILSIEIQILIGLFIIIAGVLIAVVVFCWRKNRKLEYRYMQLIENNNPDDDPTVDNVCAQLSDEDDSGEEVQFTAPSKAKRILNVVRKAIGKNSTNGRSEPFNGDSFLLNNTSTNDA